MTIPRRLERMMGLSWQQGPLGRNPNGQFLVPGMPEHVLYAEPLRRRMRAELDGRTVVQSDEAVVLFEPGRYPVAYFPIADFAEGALRPTERRTEHPELGETAWFDIDGVSHAAWSYRAPFDDMAAIGDFVSFEPDRVEVTLDGERLELEPGQTVVSHGIDRNLSIDEAGALTACVP
jgi:uncharacterized protein (DUF427 family)